MKKQFKRVASLVLVVAMLLSSFTVAFAATSTDATKMETLGIIKGSGNGVTDEYLATTPMRAQAALMYIRLKGLEDEALAFTETETFVDATNVEAFWQPILAYLKANPELGWIGDQNGNFNAYGEITAQAYVKVMLEALGYKQDVEFTWDEVFTFATTVGLTQPTGTFNVAALASSTVEALEATNADGKVLIEDLVDQGIVDKDKAIEAGLVEEVTELAVVGATMNNLAEVVITFNDDIDSDNALVANFEVKANDVAKAIDNVVVDGNVVTLNMTVSAINQQDSIEVTVKEAVGIKEDTTIEIGTVIDRELPEVEKIELNGPNAFKVFFSEPLLTAPSAKINNQAIADTVTFTVGSKEAIITAGSSLKAGTTYTLEISNATDFNGYKMVTYTEDVTYEEVEEVVTVEVTDVTETTVEVTFNTEVTGVTASSAWHSFSSYAPSAVNTTDNKVFTFTFHNGTTGYYIPYANVTFKLLAEDIEDAWGNEMSEDFVTTIKSVEDAEAPTVKVIEVEDNQTTIEFSEAVKAFTDAEVTMKDSDDEEITVTVKAGDEDNQYVIEYAEQSGGSYTITIEDVVDNSLAENALNPNPTILALNITDTTAPAINSAVAVYAGEVIFVKYDEAMNTSVLDLDAYRGITGGGAQVTPEKAEFWGTNNKEVKLTFAEGSDLSLLTGLMIGKVADSSNNYVEAISTIVSVSAAATAPILEVKTIDTNKVEIIVEGIVEEGLDTDNILVANQGSSATVAAASISVEYNEDGNTVITATLQAGVTFAANEVPDSVTISNMVIDKGFNVTTVAFTSSTDGIAPTYVSSTNAGLDLDGATTGVAIKFDENLNAAYALAIAHELVIVADGETLNPVLDYTTRLHGTNASILVIEFTKTVTDVTVDTIVAPQYIQDASGNNADAIEDALEFTF